MLFLFFKLRYTLGLCFLCLENFLKVPVSAVQVDFPTIVIILSVVPVWRPQCFNCSIRHNSDTMSICSVATICPSKASSYTASFLVLNYIKHIRNDAKVLAFTIIQISSGNPSYRDQRRKRNKRNPDQKRRNSAFTVCR